MAFRLSTLEKLHVLKISLDSVNDYDPYLKLALPIIRRLYLTLLSEHDKSPETAICIAELDQVMELLKRKLKKQENYNMVIRQVNFN